MDVKYRTLIKSYTESVAETMTTKCEDFSLENDNLIRIIFIAIGDVYESTLRYKKICDKFLGYSASEIWNYNSDNKTGDKLSSIILRAESISTIDGIYIQEDSYPSNAVKNFIDKNLGYKNIPNQRNYYKIKAIFKFINKYFNLDEVSITIISDECDSVKLLKERKINNLTYCTPTSNNIKYCVNNSDIVILLSEISKIDFMNIDKEKVLLIDTVNDAVNNKYIGYDDLKDLEDLMFLDTIIMAHNIKDKLEFTWVPITKY